MTAMIVTLDVSYSQIAIFAAKLQQPFNDWTDAHVAQGFAWRPGSVSFRTLNETGPHLIEIEVVDHVGSVSADTIRAIEVPFEVPSDGAIELASISDSVSLSLPTGTFLLRCEFFRNGIGKIRLTFASKDAPRFAIVRSDETLSTQGELLTIASAAPG